jgi:hypothetical protein
MAVHSPQSMHISNVLVGFVRMRIYSSIDQGLPSYQLLCCPCTSIQAGPAHVFEGSVATFYIFVLIKLKTEETCSIWFKKSQIKPKTIMRCNFVIWKG